MNNSKSSFCSFHRLSIPTVLFIVLTFVCHLTSEAQFSLVVGGNYSGIRNNISIENKGSVFGYNFGLSAQFHPFTNFQRFSIISEVNFNQKGYRQDIEESYSFRFGYLSWPILGSYSLSKDLSICSGVELSELISTNVRQGLKTYNNFDFGLVFGIGYFEERRLSGFTRFTYGLTHMLDYYDIDEQGNFGNEIHDLKNVYLSLGIKFKLFDEKIF